METVYLRKLTLKSCIDFGKYKDYSVQQVFSIDKKYLIWMYYNCSNLSFIDELLEMLFITKEYQIKKPGVLRESEQMIECLKSEKIDRIGNLNPLDRWKRQKSIDSKKKKRADIFNDKANALNNKPSVLQAKNHFKM